MLRLFLVLSLMSALIISLIVENSSARKPDDYPEDYGCVHDNHSQYDDGDSANIDFLNENFSKIH